jgi:hypothetical protein
MPKSPETLKAINIQPTWEGMVWEMLRILPHATPKGRGEIHREILRAAAMADKWVAHVEAQKE